MATQTTGKKRDIVLDLLKLFSILLMLGNHSIAYLSDNPYLENPAYRLMSSVSMPLFMSLAGYFSASLTKRTLLGALRHRAFRLLLPMVCFSLPLIIRCIWLGYEPEVISRFAMSLYWFLKAAFVCAFLWLTCRAVFRKAVIYVPVSMCIAIFLAHVPYFDGMRLYDMYFFFLYGLLLHRRLEWFKARLIQILYICGAVYVASMIFSEAAIVPENSFLRNYPAVYNRDIHKLISMFIAFWGVSFFISLFFLVFGPLRENPKVKKISIMGRYTLGIYLVQAYVLEAAGSLLFDFTDQPLWLFTLVLAPLCTLAAFIICLSVTLLLRRWRLTSIFLLGTLPEKDAKKAACQR